MQREGVWRLERGREEEGDAEWRFAATVSKREGMQSRVLSKAAPKH